MTSFQQFEQHSSTKIKWLAHVTGRQNKDKIKIFTFHITSNKSFSRKPASILERAITRTRLETYFLRFYKFQATEELAARSLNDKCLFIRKQLILPLHPIIKIMKCVCVSLPIAMSSPILGYLLAIWSHSGNVRRKHLVNQHTPYSMLVKVGVS